MKKNKIAGRGEDNWAIGADADNHVVVPTPQELARMTAERNAEEALYDEPPPPPKRKK